MMRGKDGDARLTEDQSLPLFVMVTPAGVTDRDAAKEVLFSAAPSRSSARRHARDHERLIPHSASLITWVAITLVTGIVLEIEPVRPRAGRCRTERTTCSPSWSRDGYPPTRQHGVQDTVAADSCPWPWPGSWR
ncbi:hypothetical protein [Streptomyces rishiriensis]|uniref:hypothetical protein n=1 Tax=Streptomyces rishiriensis TaxID=68264 RepID=UPI0037D47F61